MVAQLLRDSERSWACKSAFIANVSHRPDEGERVGLTELLSVVSWAVVLTTAPSDLQDRLRGSGLGEESHGRL